MIFAIPTTVTHSENKVTHTVSICRSVMHIESDTARVRDTNTQGETMQKEAEITIDQIAHPSQGQRPVDFGHLGLNPELFGYESHHPCTLISESDSLYCHCTKCNEIGVEALKLSAF